jgi:AraC-like DNA-binding protein
MAKTPNSAVDFLDHGFHLGCGQVHRMSRPHRHNEIEITVLEAGWIDYLFGGRMLRIPAGCLCVRWAAIPHQSLGFDPGGLQYSLKIPLAWFLNWQLPEKLVQRLLAGELVVDREPDPGCSDLAMMRRWHAAYLSGKPEQRRIVLLESEARLLRLSAGLLQRDRRSRTSSVHGQFGKVELMTAFVASNYTKHIDIADIAASAGMHPNSAMRLFRRSCGMTLLEYVNMHRVWHAQYLLAGTDMKIRLVAERCGFASASRFYATFEHVVGQRPGDYRRSLASGSGR